MEDWKTKLLKMVLRVEGGLINDRAWLYSGPLKAYVRVTKRQISGEVKNTIDIASVEVLQEKRNSGVFSSWLKDVEAIAKKHNRTIYVENVLDKHLENYLIKLEYKSCTVGGVNSYWKFLA